MASVANTSSGFADVPLLKETHRSEQSARTNLLQARVSDEDASRATGLRQLLSMACLRPLLKHAQSAKLAEKCVGWVRENILISDWARQIENAIVRLDSPRMGEHIAAMVSLAA